MSLIYNEKENFNFKKILRNKPKDLFDQLSQLDQLEKINFQNISIKELEDFFEKKSVSKYHFTKDYPYHKMIIENYSSLACLPVIKSENFDFIHDGIIFVHDLNGINNQYISFSFKADDNLINHGTVMQSIIKRAKYIYLLKSFCKHNNFNEPRFDNKFLNELGKITQIEELITSLEKLKEIKSFVHDDTPNSSGISNELNIGKKEVIKKLKGFGYLECLTCDVIEHPLLQSHLISEGNTYKCYDLCYEEYRDAPACKKNYNELPIEEF